MTVEPQARIGEVFESKYQIEELLGTGAMGSVFRARHVAIGRPVAVKLLHPRLLKDPKLCKRFEREAELAGKLRHPNVVGVVDVGTHEGVSFLVMDLAHGVSLTTLLEQGPIAHATALELIRQLCNGLEHAHEHGLIHRDLKPDNIIVDRDGTARIVDFGIALLREGSDSPAADRLTTGGVVLGTPHYMAPELAMGTAIDHRIDLFALGVICFQMLAGRMPFAGDGVTVAMANIQTPTPKMGIDPLLEAFTHKLMAKQPGERPASAAAARELLDLIAADRTAAADKLGIRDPGIAATAEMEPLAAGLAIGTAATVAIGTAPTIAISTEKLLPRRPRTRLWIAIALLVVLAGAAIALALRETASSPAPALTPTSHDEPAADPPAQLPSHEPAPPPLAVPPEPAAEPKPIRTTPGTEKPAAPALTAESVARHYAAVGRKLKVLTNAGADTAQLWARYKSIRINEVMATAADLARTEALLVEIERAMP